MNSEFKSKYCQFCLNKTFEPNSGLSCGLENKPTIQDYTCPKYNPNTELIERTKYQQEKRNQTESKKTKFEKFKNIIIIILVAFCLISLGIRWLTLESDYRYILAKVHVTRQSGTDKTFGIGGYTCEFDYVFEVEGISYYNKGSLGSSGRGGGLPKPIWPKKFLVKYSPNDPTLNSVISRIDVSDLKFNDIPSNGILPDSLDYYLKKKTK
jgi:hypothetical protein